MEVVGTLFIENKKLLLDKPRKRPTYQMVGGKVEKNETPLIAAIRESHEELGSDVILDETKFQFIMEFDEIASSDDITPIHFYLFKYNGSIIGKTKESLEIEKFCWYDSKCDIILSNTLKHKVIPYCLEKELIN